MRSILKHQTVFDNFIRCLYLFNKMIFSRQELLLTVQPFFCKSPEMFAWLKEFVNRRDDQGLSHEPISQAILKLDRVPEEQGIEIGEECTYICY
jgi:histone deacetylase complex regulatory component SIN3